MKNKYYLIIYCLILILVGGSCSDDFLQDMQNYGETDDSFYENETYTTWYVDNVYYDFYSAFTSPIATLVGSYSTDYTKMTEEIGGIQDFINPTLTYEDADDGSSYYGTTLANKIYNEPYTRIRDCTSFLEEVDTKGSSLDIDFRDESKGQMYYLRAIQYFDLMRVYGGVPIVTDVETATSTDESIKLPRASVAEVVDQIVADFDSAASLLPATWGSSDYGRPTKGAALAQKSRVLLTFASPLFNTDWDNESSERWQNALQAGLAAETELTADGYGLYGSSAKDWEDMFLVDNSFCSEAICVQLLASGNSSSNLNNSWENTVRLTSQDGGGGQAAPKEMIDLFPMADGSRPTTENGYDDFHFFLNRDPRFYRTFAFSGCKWGYKESSEDTVWTYRWVNSSGSASFSESNSMSSPAFVRKMSNTEASVDEGFSYSGTDIFEYRYAELLLNIAECYAATGDVTNCITYLGKIRNRVGIPSANNYGIGTLSDKYAAIEACLYERRVELAYEGKRFWDVQRWMLYNDDTNYNNSTCAKLGIDPINGTKRTGYYLQYNNVADSDPLEVDRTGYGVDPDDDNFESELSQLASFYTNNFEFADLETPMDNVNGDAVTIDWKSNYYIMGLTSTILSQNSWLEQTMGWLDASGSEGTFNYQE